jgi:hypothetical protein
LELDGIAVALLDCCVSSLAMLAGDARWRCSLAMLAGDARWDILDRIDYC